MSVPFDGWRQDMPAELRALVDDLDAGLLMVVLVRRGRCRCPLATVKRVHGRDVLAIRRRALVSISSTRREALWQLDAVLLDDPDHPVDLVCRQGRGGRRRAQSS